MKRKKIDIDAMLKRHLPKPTNEDVEKAGADGWNRLREQLKEMPEALTSWAEDTPAANAMSRMREIDDLVLRSIELLDGTADLFKMPSIVSELLGEPVDQDAIMMSLKRLDRKGAISMKALFPADAPVQETVTETEPLKAGNLAKEKL